jgi:hypothetical protein
VKVSWAVRSRLKDLGAHYKAVATEYKAGEWYIDLDLSNLWEWISREYSRTVADPFPRRTAAGSGAQARLKHLSVDDAEH